MTIDQQGVEERQRQPILPGAHNIECTCERCRRPDIVQVQKEAWAQIAQEEREGKRRPPILKLSTHDLYMERIFHGF